jgi:hypothetical protein
LAVTNEKRHAGWRVSGLRFGLAAGYQNVPGSEVPSSHSGCSGHEGHQSQDKDELAVVTQIGPSPRLGPGPMFDESMGHNSTRLHSGNYATWAWFRHASYAPASLSHRLEARIAFPRPNSSSEAAGIEAAASYARPEKAPAPASVSSAPICSPVRPGIGAVMSLRLGEPV